MGSGSTPTLGKFRTRGSLHFGFLSLGLSRLSHPEIRGNAVYARTYSMKVMGLNVTRPLRKMEAKFNPVVDLDELAQPLRLNKSEKRTATWCSKQRWTWPPPVRLVAEVAKWRERQRERGRKRGRKET